MISSNISSISIIGLSKNAGKTTALNALIKEYQEEYVLGVVSVGVDGEKSDVWSHRPKPPIFVKKGMVVATAGVYLDEHPGDWEVVDMIPMETIVGPLFIAKARNETAVKLVGISSMLQLQAVLARLKEKGAMVTFVDGAYDRKSSASPTVTDGVIVVVGASAATSLVQLERKVEELIFHFTLPKSSNELFLKAGELAMNQRCVVMVDQAASFKTLSSISSLREKTIQSHLKKEKAQCIVFPGALTDSVLRKLMGWRVPILIPDATHLFASLSQIKQFTKKGGSIYVLQPINLVGMAMNPTSPDGYSFQSEKMFQCIQKHCSDIGIFNVMRGKNA